MEVEEVFLIVILNQEPYHSQKGNFFLIIFNDVRVVSVNGHSLTLRTTVNVEFHKMFLILISREQVDTTTRHNNRSGGTPID